LGTSFFWGARPPISTALDYSCKFVLYPKPIKLLMQTKLCGGR